MKKSKGEPPDRASTLAGLGPMARLWNLHARLIVSALIGAAVAGLLARFSLRWPTRILIGWDIGVALYLALVCRVMAHEIDREDPATRRCQ